MRRRQFILRLSLVLMGAGCTSKRSARENEPQEADSILAEGEKQSLPETGPNRISGPYTHKNLSVYLVHGKEHIEGQEFLTLGEALEQNKVLVHETGNVNELLIENISQDPVYVQSGDIVKGGKQDRVFRYDIVIAAGSGRVPVASFCVEQGRWSKRGAESTMHFSASQNQLASKELKLAAKFAEEQGEVWNEVARLQTRLMQVARADIASMQSATSLELTLESESVQGVAKPYLKALSGIIDDKEDVIGYAFSVNGQINSADLYTSRSLFRKLWSKLLESSVAEAVANSGVAAAVKAPTVEEIGAWLNEAQKGKVSENKVSNRIKRVIRESEKDLVFESVDSEGEGDWLHRNYIRK